MSTSVVAYESASLDARMKYANTIAAAGQMIPRGLFDPATGKPSPAKVLLVMETGSMLGLHPMAALQSINVVEGRATLAAQLMAGLIRQAGHRLEIVKSGTIPGGDYAVTVTGTRADTGDVFTSTWDMHRAIRAQLVDSYEQNPQGVFVVRARSEKGKLLPWEAYAESMPKWRAISEVALEGFSDVTLGMRSYEEMTDGGIPMAEPDPEPSEDWLALFASAKTRADLDAVAARLAEKGEGTDKLRAAFMARAGVIAREEQTVDAEIVADETTGGGEAVDGDHPEATGVPATVAPGPEMTPEEFEAAEAARFDAEHAEVVDRD
ncbi:hypothetical protein MicroSTF_14315 [Microbacterium sp. STF-2]|uniref:hypothetical protein n=1 Tax=Microbacterium sp. STF-2 TaxID=3031132 RepID=UPI002AFF14EA|nr:hypothetical protein [Microbacterium sp. STF-2]MEA1264214.1 hypothetical protein [Microbacterium sp. STF-2]